VSTFDGKFSAYSIRVFLKSDACTLQRFIKLRFKKAQEQVLNG